MFWECKVAPGAVPPLTCNALCSPARAFFAAGLLILLLLVVGGCGRSQSAVTETKDAYQVTFTTNPAPPGQGEGTVILTVRDKQGRPVDGAQVAIEGNMSHAGMTPVSAVSTSSANGEYRLPMNWTMGGSWYVDVKISLANGEAVRRRFPVDVK